jgi:hypothetical protein
LLRQFCLNRYRYRFRYCFSNGKDFIESVASLDVTIVATAGVDDVIGGREARCAVPLLSKGEDSLLRVVCPFTTPRTVRSAFRLRGSGRYVFKVDGEIEAMLNLPDGVQLSICSKGIYDTSTAGGDRTTYKSIRERLLQWSFYHRALGVQRLYIPEQPFFFKEEDYTECEASVYKGWAVQGPGMFPFLLHKERERTFSKRIVDYDMRIRLNFCMHEYYYDHFIILELSIDEFLVCPSTHFVCDGPTGAALDAADASCFGSDENRKNCHHKCFSENSNPRFDVSPLLNSTQNRMEHPQVCFKRLLMLNSSMSRPSPHPSTKKETHMGGVYGKDWEANTGFRGQPKCMCNPSRFYRAGVHGCRFDGFSSIYESGLEYSQPRSIQQAQDAFLYASPSHSSRCYIHHMPSGGSLGNMGKATQLSARQTPASDMQARLFWQELYLDFVLQCTGNGNATSKQPTREFGTWVKTHAKTMEAQGVARY